MATVGVGVAERRLGNTWRFGVITVDDHGGEYRTTTIITTIKANAGSLLRTLANLADDCSASTVLSAILFGGAFQLQKEEQCPSSSKLVL